MSRLLKTFARKKCFDEGEMEKTALKRGLSTFQLTTIGIGSTLGAGLYIVAGDVAKNKVGPAIVVSFAIAAFVAYLGALSYAEFAARVPRAGSAYTYSYVTMGEFSAFVIGWMMVMTNITGTSAVVRGWGEFISSLCGDCVKDFLVEHVGRLHQSWLAEYPDFVALAFALFISAVTCYGVSTSAAFTSLFTILNLGVVLFITVVGFCYADARNWDSFAPFGFQGILSGSVTLMFALIGFEVVATAGEEATNPRKAIPRSILASLTIVFVAYECVVVSLTLMIRYDKLPESSALATSFDEKGFSAGKYIVSIGALCAMSSSALSGAMGIPRILYSMANDGLIFSCFAATNPRTHTPLYSCVVSGLLIALLAVFLKLSALADVVGLSTLSSFMIVSICVILLRYKPESLTQERANAMKEEKDCEEVFQRISTSRESTPLSYVYSTRKFRDAVEMAPPVPRRISPLKRIMTRAFGRKLATPDGDTYLTVKTFIVLFIVSAVAVESSLIWRFEQIKSNDPPTMALVVVSILGMATSAVVIARQPEQEAELYFKVPFVPFVPLASVFADTSLLLQFNAITWAQFGIFTAIGILIYFTYGIKHSKLNDNAVESEIQHDGYEELNNSVN